MKLSKDFIIHSSNDEHILVSTGTGSFSGLVRMNALGAFLANLLNKDTTEEDMVNAVLAEYEVDREQAAADVHVFIEKLSAVGAIKE